jgi:hypothetical protein
MKGRYEPWWHDAPLSGARCVVTEPGWLQVTPRQPLAMAWS